MTEKKLAVIDGETLMDQYYAPARFCVQSLLPQGVTILGGAPKIGKSWLVLDLCVHVSSGTPMWNLPVTKGTTLYLCLEDTHRRIQQRLSAITDEVSPNVFFAVEAETLATGIREQIRDFVSNHPDTVLVVIDTFQMVRSESDASYAGDYSEVQQMKKLADELGISLLLVHHLRKQGDNDPLNKLSGTTGISGAVDAVFIMERSQRDETHARLVCTGRDIEYRELELRFSAESCTWELERDSVDEPVVLLPTELEQLVAFMKERRFFTGSNSELAENLSIGVSAKSLKQLMNKHKYLLAEHGVTFHSHRSNGHRLVDIFFSAVPVTQVTQSDTNIGGAKICGPCVPCDPVAPL